MAAKKAKIVLFVIIKFSLSLFSSFHKKETNKTKTDECFTMNDWTELIQWIHSQQRVYLQLEWTWHPCCKYSATPGQRHRPDWNIMSLSRDVIILGFSRWWKKGVWWDFLECNSSLLRFLYIYMYMMAPKIKWFHL